MEDSNIAKHMLLNLKLSYLTMSSSTQIHIYSETKRKTVTGLPIFLYELQYPPVLKRVMDNLPCVDDFPIETSIYWCVLREFSGIHFIARNLIIPFSHPIHQPYVKGTLMAAMQSTTLFSSTMLPGALGIQYV